MFKIRIDPGHGGKDSGALGGGWMEKDINLEAALYIGQRLAEHGFTVGFTRTADVDPGDEYDRGRSAKGYDYFISIHCNAGGGTGAEVYTNARETAAYTETWLRELLEPLVGWRKIASRLYDTGAFVTRTADGAARRFTDRFDENDWYGVLRGCWSVGVSGDLLEMFFIDSERDRKVFDADRKAVYEAVVEALCGAFSIKYLAPGGEQAAEDGGRGALCEPQEAAVRTVQNENSALRERIARAVRILEG
jgi:N-acetylmuramoyl-L-alanine amidase